LKKSAHAPGGLAQACSAISSLSHGRRERDQISAAAGK